MLKVKLPGRCILKITYSFPPEDHPAEQGLALPGLVQLQAEGQSCRRYFLPGHCSHVLPLWCTSSAGPAFEHEMAIQQQACRVCIKSARKSVGGPQGKSDVLTPHNTRVLVCIHVIHADEEAPA